MHPFAALATTALALAALATAPQAAHAAAPAPAGGPCDALGADARATANRVMATLHAHDCCDTTLDRCLTARPSRLVRRLADAICRRVAKGQTPEVITEALTRRAESMLGKGRAATVDASAVAWAGAPDAKVQIVAYACTRCPLCARWVPTAYDAVSAGGPLYGKARLAMRLFPLSGHAGAKEGALALEAARLLGAFWPFTLKLMRDYDRFAVERFAPWAAELGLDAAAFRKHYDAPATAAALVASKKEGLRNGVRGTPQPFINGKEYSGDLDLEAFVDAVLEEADRVDGTLCKP